MRAEQISRRRRTARRPSLLRAVRGAADRRASEVRDMAIKHVLRANARAERAKRDVLITLSERDVRTARRARERVCEYGVKSIGMHRADDFTPAVTPATHASIAKTLYWNKRVALPRVPLREAVAAAPLPASTMAAVSTKTVATMSVDKSYSSVALHAG